MMTLLLISWIILGIHVCERRTFKLSDNTIEKHLFTHVRSEDNYTLFPVIDNQPIMNVSASNEVCKHA